MKPAGYPFRPRSGRGVRLSGLASSWAAFLIHAGAFLSPNGRLAMVLPAAKDADDGDRDGQWTIEYSGQLLAVLALSPSATTGWYVGLPSYHDERRQWVQYAFDPCKRRRSARGAGSGPRAPSPMQPWCAR